MTAAAADLAWRFGELRLPRGRAAMAVLSLFLAVALMPGSAVRAREFDGKEKAELATTVADFNAAMVEARYDRIVKTIPPRVLAAMAEKAGTTSEKLVPDMISLMQALLEKVKIESFSMDLAKADYKEAKSGMPYVLIPTETVMSIGGKDRIKETSSTLGIIEDGQWYLLRVADPGQLAIMRDVYPELSDLAIPTGSQEVLQ